MPALTADEISRQMSCSMRGELTEQSETHFSHPSSVQDLPPMLSALSALGYAIQDQNLRDVAHILRESNQFLLNQFDYSGNTPLVRAPVCFLRLPWLTAGTTKHLASTSPSIEILRDFLSQGASVHIRNRDGHTPLFLAAEAGRVGNVRLLRESGAHLHADERDIAAMLKKRGSNGGGGDGGGEGQPGGDGGRQLAWVLAGA